MTPPWTLLLIDLHAAIQQQPFHSEDWADVYALLPFYLEWLFLPCGSDCFPSGGGSALLLHKGESCCSVGMVPYCSTWHVSDTKHSCGAIGFLLNNKQRSWIH